MCKLKVLSLLALLAVSSTLFADQVTLKNGDRLTGTIVKSDGKTLVIHTDAADDVTIKFDAIQGDQERPDSARGLKRRQDGSGPGDHVGRQG